MSCRIKATDMQSKKKIMGIYAKDFLEIDIRKTHVISF